MDVTKRSPDTLSDDLLALGLRILTDRDSGTIVRPVRIGGTGHPGRTIGAVAAYRPRCPGRNTANMAGVNCGRIPQIRQTNFVAACWWWS